MEKTVRALLGELAEPPVLIFPDWEAVEDDNLTPLDTFTAMPVLVPLAPRWNRRSLMTSSARLFSSVERPWVPNATPVTGEDRPGHSRISMPDNVGVYMIRASGHTPLDPTTHGVGLGGLLPSGQGETLQGTPLAPDGFQEFSSVRAPNEHLDDLDAPPEEFPAHAFPNAYAGDPFRHLSSRE